MGYGRLYGAAGLGGIGIVLFLYFLGGAIFWAWVMGDYDFFAVTCFAGVLIALVPPLAVRVAGGNLGVMRLKQVVRIMGLSQLILLPLVLGALTVVVVLWNDSSGLLFALYQASIIAGPVVVSMLSLKVALVATGVEREAPERPVEAPTDGW